MQQQLTKNSSEHQLQFNPADFSVLIFLTSLNPSAKPLSLLPQLPLSPEQVRRKKALFLGGTVRRGGKTRGKQRGLDLELFSLSFYI